MSNTLFPVFIYEEGMELPKEGTYFLVSGNGLWLHKDTGIVRAFVPVDNISVLQDLDAKTQVGMSIPKLPANHVYKIKKFFQEVVATFRSEAATVLYYNKQTGDFKIQITDQFVSHGGVQYKRIGLSHTEEMANYLRVGTIHSHCDFGAFHSGTDIGDEEDFDGLHCTFGHNDKEQFSITASIVVNGNRLEVDPMTVLEGVELIGEVEDRKMFWGKRHVDNYFRLVDPDNATLSEWESERETWLSHVRGHGLPSKPVDGISIGSKVSWAGDLSTVQLKTLMGEGPFNVIRRTGDKIVIKTNVGLANFSVKLFRKDES